jgi:hypothetical protein
MVMHRWAIVVSVILFGVACALPALEFQKFVQGVVQGPDVKIGVTLLLIGWLGPFALQFAWFANPLLGLSLWALAFRRWNRAAVFAVLALLLSVQTFQLFWQDVPADEGRVGQLRLQQVQPGFFAWQGAILVALATAVLAGGKKPVGNQSSFEKILR